MKYLEKYEGNKSYVFPNNVVATPEVMQNKWPAIKSFTYIIETDEAGEMCYAIDKLSALRSRYDIDKSLTDNEAIVAIQEIINMPEPEPEVTAEERIASALEFQNLMSMDDVEEGV